MSHLQPIQDRASGKLSGWQGKLFNIGGGKELVRSMLSSVPVYLMIVVKPPKRLYKETILVGGQPAEARWKMQSEMGSSVSSFTSWWSGGHRHGSVQKSFTATVVMVPMDKPRKALVQYGVAN
jgi:hypothetical protein